jgi:cytochrome c-type biogenesis protein CcmH/NrfG
VLLDRRKVRFWQKIIFGGMAFLMAAFLIFWYSGVLNGCTWFNGAQEDVTKTLDQEITKYQTATTTDPKDVAAWISLAEAYLSRSGTHAQGSDATTADLASSASAYQKAARVLAKQKGSGIRRQRIDVLNQLATVYGSLGDASAVERVYQELTALTPKDSQAFLNLGSAARSAGDTSTALLAFTRFLQLDPKSPYVKDVKDAIAQLSPSSSPTPTPSPTK